MVLLLLLLDREICVVIGILKEDNAPKWSLRPSGFLPQ